MKLPVRDAQGKELEQIEVDEAVFGITPNKAVIHQVYVAQMNARRQGIANTKTRGEVQGSTAKLRQQKGLGRARIGSASSPVLTGGGVAFGPKTRSYEQSVPKRIKRLAIRSVLSAKAGAGQLHIIDSMGESASTSAMKALLGTLGIERTTLLVTGAQSQSVKLSARNLSGTRVMPAGYLNVADMVNHQSLVMTTDAIRAAEALWGGERAGRRRSAEAVAAPVEAATPAKRRSAKAAAAPVDVAPSPKRGTRTAKPKVQEIESASPAVESAPLVAPDAAVAKPKAAPRRRTKKAAEGEEGA